MHVLSCPQAQRLERAGAVFLPHESMDAMNVSPSPPPAYHTVVRLPPPSCKPADTPLSPSSPGAAGSGATLIGDTLAGATLTGDTLDGATLTGAPLTRVGPDVLAKLAAGTCSGPGAAGFNELDADGLPSYEAALKLESQGHI